MVRPDYSPNAARRRLASVLHTNRRRPAPLLEYTVADRSLVAPLTTAERELLEKVLPVVRRVVRRVVGQWNADAEELTQQAAIFAAEAVRQFDGRGNLPGFVGLRVKQRLTDYMMYERRRRKVRSPLQHLRNGRRRQETCRDVVLANRPYAELSKCELGEENQSRHYAGDEAAILDDPSRPLQLAEAAAAVRHCLSTRELEVFRLRCDGKTPDVIAAELRVTKRHVYGLLSGIRQRLNRESLETCLPVREIEFALLESDRIALESAMRFLGYSDEEISETAKNRLHFRGAKTIHGLGAA